MASRACCNDLHGNRWIITIAKGCFLFGNQVTVPRLGPVSCLLVAACFSLVLGARGDPESSGHPVFGDMRVLGLLFSCQTDSYRIWNCVSLCSCSIDVDVHLCAREAKKYSYLKMVNLLEDKQIISIVLVIVIEHTDLDDNIWFDTIWPICYSFFEDCLIRSGSQERGRRENSPQQWRGNSFVSSGEKEPSWKAKFCIYQLISVLILTYEPAGCLVSALGMVKRSQRSQVRLRGHPEASLVPISGGFGGCVPLEGESREHPGHTGGNMAPLGSAGQCSRG